MSEFFDFCRDSKQLRVGNSSSGATNNVAAQSKAVTTTDEAKVNER